MLYFLEDKEEISLLKFLGKFQYMNSDDTKYFFTSNSYYKKRIKKLVDNQYLKKEDNMLFLTSRGTRYLKSIDCECVRPNSKPDYIPRLLYLSNLGAFYYNCPTVTFTPSYQLKDNECYTMTSRRYIGLFNINGVKYLSYHILKKHDNRYKGSVSYDIDKETQYRNIIILVEDISKINLENFTFGYNSILIVEDNETNKERLKYLNSINWHKIITNEYKNADLSPHIYCDYEDSKGNYISYFYFYDTEKVNRINQFLAINKDKQATIFCSKELKPLLQQNIIKAKYNVIDIDKLVDRKKNIYYG